MNGLHWESGWLWARSWAAGQERLAQLEVCRHLVAEMETNGEKMENVTGNVLKRKLLIGIYVLAAIYPLRAQAASQPFEIVITNGHIIDGTGSPWYSGDIGIRSGKIFAIGNLTAAPRKRTIDAAGKVVAPGFIDMLGQSELTILVDPRLPSKIYQGI